MTEELKLGDRVRIKREWRTAWFWTRFYSHHHKRGLYSSRAWLRRIRRQVGTIWLVESDLYDFMDVIVKWDNGLVDAMKYEYLEKV